MEKKPILDNLLENNIICNKCLNIPLLGIEFSNEAKSISDIIKLHSFCLFHKTRNKVNEFPLNNIYKEKEKNKNKNKKNIKINCENCKKNENEYLCLNCKRIICKKCFNYHKSHKVYENNKYLLSKDDFDKIDNKFKNAKTNLNNNLIFIKSKIDSFKSQLHKLENLYKEYKDINDKLMALANFILKKYKNGIISDNSIYYPIYFNVKNVLEFNFQEFNIKDEDLSINSFTNYILDKIKSGSFFLLLDSKFNKNLNDYANEKWVNLSTLKLDEFKEIKVEYSKFILLEDKSKLIGIKKGSSFLEVFNIQNGSIETSIKLDINIDNFNIFYKDNLLLLISDLEVYIFNSKTFTIMQQITLEKNFDRFIYGEILSKDSIGIIYKGSLSSLEDFSLIKNYINLPISKYNMINIANIKEEYIDSFERNSFKYMYFLIYKKDNSDKFLLKKIILLIKENIAKNEVKYVSDDSFDNRDDDIYCTFYFDSLNKYSDTEFVIAFKSKILEKREQYCYYITDKIYSNETIYYYLNINDELIKKKICSTKENSFLHKIGNTFYFLFSESEKSSFKLKNLLKDYEFIEIKMDKMNKNNFRDFYYQNKNILGWNKKLIFSGKINSNNELEIIRNNIKSYNIISICLNPNIIFYDNSIQENGEESNEESNEDSNEDNNEKSNEDSNESS